jgi:hypothetical protein
VRLHDGVATFAGLADNKAETITLDFSAGNLTSPVSTTVVLSPSVASKLVITQQPSATAIDGAAFTTPPIVTEEDQYNNTITSDSSTVITAALSIGDGPLQGTTTLALNHGIASFTNLFDDKAETIALSFSGGGLTTGPSTDISISQQATQLVIKTEPSATLTAGQTFAVEPVIQEEDRFGNLVTGDNSTVVTVSFTGAAGGLQGSTSVTVSAGVATFTNLSVDHAPQVGSLEFSSNGLTSAVSSSITITPAAATQLVITQQPSSPSTVGTAFSTQPIVVEKDRFGNIETTDSSTAVTATVSSGNATLEGPMTVTLSDGIASFSGLAGASAGTMAISFSGDGLVSPSTTQILIQSIVTSIISPPQAPVIASYSVTTTRKLNAKGKPTGPSLLVYTFNFSEPMNSSIGNAANFEIDTVVIKKKKQSFQAIAFNLSEVSNTSVRLTLTSAQKFANGGQIIVRSGLESALNASLNSGKNSVFSIARRGLGITEE